VAGTSIVPRLSVVVACVDAVGTIDACLSSLRTACDALAAEVIVVHPADRALSSRVQEAHGWVRLLTADASALVPDMWAQGYRVSRGEVVAFSTGHSIVTPTWAQSLLDELAAGATGAGGALELAPGAGLLATAVYLLRYSAFMPPPPAGAAHEIPGDNAAYLRTALDRHAASFANGFWEVDFHRRIRPEGARLSFAPGATAAMLPDFSLGAILRHRYLHARVFGRERVRERGEPRWRVALAAPLVPLVLAARALKRVTGRRRLRARELASLPALLVVAAAWAAGEGVGALAAGRSERREGRE
jgi:hypothetical protein